MFRRLMAACAVLALSAGCYTFEDRNEIELSSVDAARDVAIDDGSGDAGGDGSPPDDADATVPGDADTNVADLPPDAADASDTTDASDLADASDAADVPDAADAACNEDMCTNNASCSSDVGVGCVCEPGYTDDGNGNCVDIDECGLGIDDCDANATCTDLVGTFSCACNTGYTGDGTTCGDIDECANGTDSCDANAVCTNTIGSFTCACPSGFTGDGLTCVDDDECAAGTDNCGPNATCTNTPGAFSCSCEMGYVGDGVICDDEDECTAGTDNCHVSATCTNSVGTFSCACNAGFIGDGRSCVDDDECARNSDNCDSNATCTNTPGTFSCACNSGWMGDGVNCIDVDECAAGTDNCNTNATCTNDQGGFTCACDTGYAGDGVTCADVDECTDGTDNCTAGVCTNNDGGFQCSCPTGYQGDGVTVCDDIDECADGSDNCLAAATCQNTPGSFTCQCPAGQKGDGVTSCVRALIISVQGAQGTLADGETILDITLTTPVDTAKAVPFATQWHDMSSASPSQFQTDIYLLDANTLRIQRNAGVGNIETTATIVEFGERAEVQTGIFNMNVGQDTATPNLNPAIVPADTFALFWFMNNNGGSQRQHNHLTMGVGSTNLTMVRSGTNGFISGHWWTVRALNGDFTVQHVPGFTIGSLKNAETTSISPIVGSRTMMLHSHRSPSTSDVGDLSHIRCGFPGGSNTDVQCVRGVNPLVGTTGVTAIRIQLVEFAAGIDVLVHRGFSSTTVNPEIGGFPSAVDLTRSMPLIGAIGIPGAETQPLNSTHRVGYAMLELTSDTTWSITRGFANMSSELNWQVVQWPSN